MPNRARVASLVLMLCAAAGGFVTADDPPPGEPAPAEPAAAEPDVPPYSMPAEDIYTEAELHQFEYRKSVPYGDESLAVLVPCRAGWKWVPVKSDDKASSDRMIPLARCEPPGEPEVAVEMKYLVLPREVRLDDWVDWFVDMQGMLVVGGQIGEYHGRRVVDAVAEYTVKDGRVFVARIGFFKSGNRIYMVAGSAPKDKYESYTNEFGLAVTSATPVVLDTSAFAEPLEEHAFPIGLRLTVLYPASWQKRESGDAPGGLGAIDLFYDDPAKPVGLIKVRAFDKERVEGLDLDKVSWSVFDEIREASPKFELVAKKQEMAAECDALEGTGRMVVYDATLDGTPVEVHELVIEAADGFFSVHLVTPPREKAPWLWLVNHRAWEIVGSRVARAR